MHEPGSGRFCTGKMSPIATLRRISSREGQNTKPSLVSSTSESLHQCVEPAFGIEVIVCDVQYKYKYCCIYNTSDIFVSRLLYCRGMDTLILYLFMATVCISCCMCPASLPLKKTSIWNSYVVYNIIFVWNLEQWNLNL